MARPRLGDSASQRLQMVITEDEVKAIDDWQFAHRVPSRSEAIRRLVQIGLRMEREITELLSHSGSMDRAVFSLIENAQAKLREVKAGDPSFETLVAIVRTMLKDANSAVHRQMDAKDHLFELVNEIVPLSNAEAFGDLAGALQEANERRAKVEAGETVLKQILAKKAEKVKNG